MANIVLLTDFNLVFVSGGPVMCLSIWPLEEHKVKDRRAALSNLYAMSEQGLAHIEGT